VECYKAMVERDHALNDNGSWTRRLKRINCCWKIKKEQMHC
jgi:hypothetical protein